MRRYACPCVHKIHNGHAFMISMNEIKLYKRVQGRRRRGGRGHVPPHFQKWGGGGGTSGLCPPPLLDRANVLISLFAHILWLKTHFFFQNFLGSLRSPTILNHYFPNFANLKLQNIFSYILL